MQKCLATLVFIGVLYTVSLAPCPAQSESLYEAYLTLPFYTRSASAFNITKTYYIAINEPGASNRNDGLSPTYRGKRRGPFKDLANVASVLALPNTGGTQVILRQGRYTVGSSGLVLPGGKDGFRPLILTSYPGETAILDGAGVNTTIVINGMYTIVQNLTIRNGSQYNVRVAGQYTIIRDNILQGASDSIKVLLGADHGLIYNNDISSYYSDGIDQFGADYWLIKSNNIHDCVTATSGILVKGGSHYTALIDNDIHDLLHVSPRGSAGIILGGSSNIAWQRRDAQGNVYAEGTRIVALSNHIWNVAANGIQFYACVDCIAESNTLYNTFYGIMMIPGNDPSYYEWDVATEPGTQGATITDNRFVGIISNVVFFILPGAETGAQAHDNVYYSDVLPDAIYGETIVKYASSPEYQQILQVRPTREYIP